MEELAAEVDEGGLWYARLGAEATHAIAHGDSFQLKDNTHCKGAPLVADLTVSPRISRENPTRGSYTHVGVKIDAWRALGLEKSYICLAGRPVSQPCLATLRGPRTSNFLRHVMAFTSLAAMFMKNSEAVKALDEVSVLGFATLQAILILLVALLFITLAQALLTCASLPSGKPIAELKAVKVREPIVTLARSALQMLSFVAGIANLVGVSLPSMIRTASPRLLVMVSLWPCTLGVYCIVRFSFLICSIQRYEAALLHGRLVLPARATARYNAIALAGVMLLFVCHFASMACNPSAERIHVALVIAVSPSLSIVKSLLSLRTVEQQQRKQTVDAKLELAELKAGGETDTHALLGGRRMVEVSEGAFCNVCRNNMDPVPVMDENSEASLGNGHAFGLGDYRWHARYVYHVTGSRAAFFNMPVTLLFVAMLILTSMQWFLQCMTNLPAMHRVEVVGGVLVPAFEPQRKFYTFYYDAATSNLELLHSLQQETTNQVSIGMSRDTYENSSIPGDLAEIDLRDLKGPWELQILAQGTWGRVREYLVQLLPESTILRSVVLRRGAWSACVARSDEREAPLYVPETFDIEVAIEEFAFSRPDGPGPPKSSKGEMYMFFAASNKSAADCTELCSGSSSCRVAWDGVGGCFFGMVPEGLSACGLQDRRAADVPFASAGPYGDFLQGRKRRTSVRICLWSEKDGRSCTVVPSNGLGLTSIPDISMPGTESARVTLEVLRSNRAGRPVSVASQSFTARTGAARVKAAWVYSRGVLMDVRVARVPVRGFDSWFSFRDELHVQIHDVDFAALPDPFPVTVVLLPDDNNFYVRPADSLQSGRCGIYIEDSSFRLPDGCGEHSELRRFTVCGGTQRIRVFTIWVPKWERIRDACEYSMILKPPRGRSHEVDRVVIVRLNLPPSFDFLAEWAVSKQCSVNFKELPEIAWRWLSPGVFQRGLHDCIGKNVTFEAFTVSTFSPLHFFLLGVTLFPEQVTLFLDEALRSENFQDEFDKLLEILPQKSGIDISIPVQAIPQEIALWAPLRLPRPVMRYLDIDELVRAHLPRALRFACLRSGITRRTAFLVMRSIRDADSFMLAVLFRCFQKKKLTLDVPMEHQSPELQAIQYGREGLLGALSNFHLLAVAVGTIARRGQGTFYAARAVVDLALAHGISMLGRRRTLNLTAMGLTEDKVRGIGDSINNSAVWRLDVSWNHLGLRGVNQLLGEMKETAKTQLRLLRVGHNFNASNVIAEQRTLRYQFLAGLQGLQELDLSGSGVGPSGAAELGPLLAAMPGLKILNLSSNNLGNEGLATLGATLGSLRALRSLDISGNNLSAVGLHALNATVFSGLEGLHLSGNLLGDDSCSALADVLAHMTRLRHLDVGNNVIGVAGAAAIGQVLGSLAALQTLDVSQNPIAEMGLIALRLALLTKLLVLDLSGTTLGEPGATALAAALPALSNLQALRLDSNNLRAAGVAAVARALPGRLTGLSLGDNSISTSKGGDSIGVSAGGKATSITDNSLGAGAVLARALQNLTQLRYLDVRHNDLRTADLRAMCEVLKSTAHLETLRIQENDFSSDASDVWSCLSGLRQVRTLDISGNQMFLSGELALTNGMTTALTGMQRLDTLVIYGNRLPPQVFTDVMDHLEHLVDSGAIKLKLLLLRGGVPAWGDFFTEVDVLMLQSRYTWILLA